MSTFTRLKRTLFGNPIASKYAHHERLPKRVALPVFASDALSSVAYATEEIMLTISKYPQLLAMGAGAAFFGLTKDFAIAIAILIFLVSLSYFNTIHAYPKGGGSYIVSMDNLGKFWGQVAGASLMIDYTLTVAVSVSAGVLAIISLVPALAPYVIPLGCGFITLLMIANLRGAKESGAIFALPTYGFILVILTTIIVGWLFRPVAPIPPEVQEAMAKYKANTGMDPTLAAMGIVLILKAFSSGCTALTGIEAVADGTQAFKEPAPRNAGIVLMTMATILSVLFLGLSFLAEKYHVMPMEVGEAGFKTVTAQIAAFTYGDGSVMFWLVQIFTAGILILAANTAYADFPRLCSFLARDGFLPRQFAVVGDRLVFQNGIIMLSVTAMLLIVIFKGNTHALIGLYAVGVFTCFTLSQFGMTVYQKKHKNFPKMIMSFVGGTICLAVTGIIAYSKFDQGVVAVPFATGALIIIFNLVSAHYKYLAQELELTKTDTLKPLRTTTLLLVPRLHKGILQAISYASASTNDARAVHVTLDQESAARIKGQWNEFGIDMPLVILESPYRSLIEPILEYIDQALAEDPDQVVTVIVPQAVPKLWFQGILHNNAALSLKAALGARKNVVITNVRYFLS
jgi:amino acid transporter